MYCGSSTATKLLRAKGQYANKVSTASPTASRITRRCKLVWPGMVKTLAAPREPARELFAVARLSGLQKSCPNTRHVSRRCPDARQPRVAVCPTALSGQKRTSKQGKTNLRDIVKFRILM